MTDVMVTLSLPFLTSLIPDYPIFPSCVEMDRQSRARDGKLRSDHYECCSVTLQIPFPWKKGIDFRGSDGHPQSTAS